jgi:hypothetical protein
MMPNPSSGTDLRVFAWVVNFRGSRRIGRKEARKIAKEIGIFFAGGAHF